MVGWIMQAPPPKDIYVSIPRVFWCYLTWKKKKDFACVIKVLEMGKLSGWALNANKGILIKKRQRVIGQWTEGKITWPGGRDQRTEATSQGVSAAASSWRAKGLPVSWGLQGEHSPANTLRSAQWNEFWNFSLQNWKKINVCCLSRQVCGNSLQQP